MHFSYSQTTLLRERDAFMELRQCEIEMNALEERCHLAIFSHSDFTDGARKQSLILLKPLTTTKTNQDFTYLLVLNH